MMQEKDRITQKSAGGGWRTSDTYYADELTACNLVKIVLMFLVALYHSCLFWGNVNWFVGVPIYDTPIIHIMSVWLNSFHIHCFTLVSGYIFYYIKYEKGRYKKFRDFVVNKFERLIIPYIFIVMIWVIPLSLYFYDWTLMDINKKYVLCTSPSQLWFLWMLFDVFMIGWCMSDKLENDKIALLIAIISFTIGVIGNKIIPNIFCIWIAARFLPLFILGMKLREKKNWFLRKIPITAYIIFDVVLFIAWKWLSAEAGSIYKIASVITGFGLNIIGALMEFFVLQEIARKIDWANSGIISYLSKRTMIIYLLHQQVIYFTISYFNGVVNPYINMLINFIVSVLVSILLANMLISNKWTRFLVGEKKDKRRYPKASPP